MMKFESKGQVLNELEIEYQTLVQSINGLTPEQISAHGVCGKWSVKDLLAHLTEWGNMFMRWYEEGLAGRVPCTPAEGFKWNQMPALNQRIYEQYKEAPLPKVEKDFLKMHQKLSQLARDIPEGDYFTPGLYTWMGRSRLALFIHANGGGHYRWARQWIVKWKKAKGIA
jgi:hypothetical protein